MQRAPLEEHVRGSRRIRLRKRRRLGDSPESLDELIPIYSYRGCVPLDRRRRKDLHRVEEKIVPLNGHTLCLAQVENLLQAETERAHQLVTIDAQYLGLRRMQA